MEERWDASSDGPMTSRRSIFKRLAGAYPDAKEYWREDVMMDRIFLGRKRFLKLGWWVKKALIPFLPKP
jgi:hypothetical protein